MRGHQHPILITPLTEMQKYMQKETNGENSPIGMITTPQETNIPLDKDSPQIAKIGNKTVKVAPPTDKIGNRTDKVVPQIAKTGNKTVKVAPQIAKIGNKTDKDVPQIAKIGIPTRVVGPNKGQCGTMNTLSNHQVEIMTINIPIMIESKTVWIKASPHRELVGITTNRVGHPTNKDPDQPVGKDPLDDQIIHPKVPMAPNNSAEDAGTVVRQTIFTETAHTRKVTVPFNKGLKGQP